MSIKQDPEIPHQSDSGIRNADSEPICRENGDDRDIHDDFNAPAEHSGSKGKSKDLEPQKCVENKDGVVKFEKKPQKGNSDSEIQFAPTVKSDSEVSDEGGYLEQWGVEDTARTSEEFAPRQQICWQFFRDGHCMRGDGCRFFHVEYMENYNRFPFHPTPEPSSLLRSGFPPEMYMRPHARYPSAPDHHGANVFPPRNIAPSAVNGWENDLKYTQELMRGRRKNTREQNFSGNLQYSRLNKSRNEYGDNGFFDGRPCRKQSVTRGLYHENNDYQRKGGYENSEMQWQKRESRNMERSYERHYNNEWLFADHDNVYRRYPGREQSNEWPSRTREQMDPRKTPEKPYKRTSRGRSRSYKRSPRSSTKRRWSYNKMRTSPLRNSSPRTSLYKRERSSSGSRNLKYCRRSASHSRFRLSCSRSLSRSSRSSSYKRSCSACSDSCDKNTDVCYKGTREPRVNKHENYYENTRIPREAEIALKTHRSKIKISPLPSEKNSPESNRELNMKYIKKLMKRVYGKKWQNLELNKPGSTSKSHEEENGRQSHTYKRHESSDKRENSKGQWKKRKSWDKNRSNEETCENARLSSRNLRNNEDVCGSKRCRDERLSQTRASKTHDDECRDTWRRSKPPHRNKPRSLSRSSHLADRDSRRWPSSKLPSNRKILVTSPTHRTSKTSPCKRRQRYSRSRSSSYCSTCSGSFSSCSRCSFPYTRSAPSSLSRILHSHSRSPSSSSASSGQEGDGCNKGKCGKRRNETKRQCKTLGTPRRNRTAQKIRRSKKETPTNIKVSLAEGKYNKHFLRILLKSDELSKKPTSITVDDQWKSKAPVLQRSNCRDRFSDSCSSASHCGSASPRKTKHKLSDDRRRLSSHQERETGGSRPGKKLQPPFNSHSTSISKSRPNLESTSRYLRSHSRSISQSSRSSSVGSAPSQRSSTSDSSSNLEHSHQLEACGSSRTASPGLPVLKRISPNFISKPQQKRSPNFSREIERLMRYNEMQESNRIASSGVKSGYPVSSFNQEKGNSNQNVSRNTHTDI